MQILKDRSLRSGAARGAGSLLLALLAFAPSVTFGQPTDAELIARGKTILTAQCSRCHQITLMGLSPLRAAPPFREVMRRYEPEALEEALAEGLSTGHESMPEFKFEPDDVNAIVAYFGTLRVKR
jgi:cytochrome c